MSENNSVSDSVERVYNDHLTISRSFRQKPFKARKNFDNFEEDGRYKHYFLLAHWFKKHPEVNRQLFFEATLYFHKTEELVPITEYVKTQALTNYTQYCRILTALNLDNPKTLERCLDSFKFIKKYCSKHHIKIEEYPNYRESSAHPIIFTHIKGNQVCRYALFAHPEYFDVVKNLYRQPEDWTFYMGDNGFTPYFYLKRWRGSVKYRKASEQFYRQIQKSGDQ